MESGDRFKVADFARSASGFLGEQSIPSSATDKKFLNWRERHAHCPSDTAIFVDGNTSAYVSYALLFGTGSKSINDGSGSVKLAARYLVGRDDPGRLISTDAGPAFNSAECNSATSTAHVTSMNALYLGGHTRNHPIKATDVRIGGWNSTPVAGCIFFDEAPQE